MNNKFIPIISVFMTISLIVFVALQFYWLKGYYGALEQDFSNKVHSALEVTTKKIGDIEIEKYYDRYKNFDEEAIKSGKQPSLTMIQTVEDSASKRQITTYKNIIDSKNILIYTVVHKCNINTLTHVRGKIYSAGGPATVFVGYS